MIGYKRPIQLGALLFLTVSCSSKQKQQNTVDKKESPKYITATLPNQNPEGIEFDKNKGVFLVSAINVNPNIATVGFFGETSQFSKNQGSIPGGSFGLQVDYKNNRLLACTNNDEAAHVAIYDLDRGDLEKLVNLSQILPEGTEYQANDLVVVGDDIYVTGRLENTIYKVSSDFQPIAFFQREGLERPNGIVYIDKGYLIVAYYTNSEAYLVKIPIDNPSDSQIIEIKNFEFRGLDGMLLTERGSLIGVTKNFEDPKKGFVLEFSSDDDWKTASLIDSIDINRSTTIAQVNPGEYYVMNQDWKTPNAENWTLERVEIKKAIK
ncbi:hypothetical protein [Seonamhaeicola maritimus]|uniref:Uncharacterized protein n=1 Tax=Seonamhaeicola maritimus TaxID=2591822 RepID=A0A5C7GDX6_9FLAO|nr:hypothetical protein [Seonamhaeicola maritimus]TXG34683.1 hypothetical protein FUA22_17380 [Seonamhaeicola maritimus]